jgi:hypothetical protein
MEVQLKGTRNRPTERGCCSAQRERDGSPTQEGREKAQLAQKDCGFGFAQADAGQTGSSKAEPAGKKSADLPAAQLDRDRALPLDGAERGTGDLTQPLFRRVSPPTTRKFNQMLLKSKFYTIYISAVITLLDVRSDSNCTRGTFCTKTIYQSGSKLGTPGDILSVKDGKLLLKPALNTTQSVLNQSNVLMTLILPLRSPFTGDPIARRPDLLGKGLQQLLLSIHRRQRLFQD